MSVFLVSCPRCHHSMKYQPMKGTIFGKTKKCVYCGKMFAVRERIVQRVSS